MVADQDYLRMKIRRFGVQKTLVFWAAADRQSTAREPAALAVQKPGVTINVQEWSFSTSFYTSGQSQIMSVDGG
jgi:hypothetical protein